MELGVSGHETVSGGRAQILEQMFDSCQQETPRNRCQLTQPEPALARLMRVIADPTLHPRRLVALEVVLRAAEIAAVAVLVLWILPVIAGSAG
jgi:hypothetical protein